MDYDTQGNVIPPYKGWKPYCLVCSTMERIKPTDYGWQCVACHNQIGKDCKHYQSPAE